MDVTRSQPARHRTNVRRASDRELVVTRLFDAPPRIIFQAWTKAELFSRWWAPKSMGTPLLSCEIDARTGGGYRLVFGQDPSNAFAFFGKYVEVVPDARLVWTNEESANGPVTTVTFEQQGEGTLLTYHELYPTTEALEEALVGMDEVMPEQFEQLDALLGDLDAAAGA